MQEVELHQVREVLRCKALLTPLTSTSSCIPAGASVCVLPQCASEESQHTELLWHQCTWAWCRDKEDTLGIRKLEEAASFSSLPMPKVPPISRHQGQMQLCHGSSVFHHTHIAPPS